VQVSATELLPRHHHGGLDQTRIPEAGTAPFKGECVLVDRQDIINA